MATTFLSHLEWWLPTILREKAVESAADDRLQFIGAADFARMLTDYVLAQITQSPAFGWTAQEFDDISDADIMDLTGFSDEVVAAGFVGAMLELSPWQGDEGMAFLVVHGVPEDDAREFVSAVERVADRLGARGQALIQQIDYATRERAVSRQRMPVAV